ncbi:MAG: hypothetical protein ACYC9O_07095 [Candidatus Latescibacterota bacterium]
MLCICPALHNNHLQKEALLSAIAPEPESSQDRIIRLAEEIVAKEREKFLPKEPQTGMDAYLESIREGILPAKEFMAISLPDRGVAPFQIAITEIADQMKCSRMWVTRVKHQAIEDGVLEADDQKRVTGFTAKGKEAFGDIDIERYVQSTAAVNQ